MAKNGNNPKIPKSDLREYLVSTREFWGKYRDGKENALWLAATVYLGALATLDSFALQPSYTISTPLKNWIVGLTIATCILALLFMCRLIKDRKDASTVISSCDGLLIRLLDSEFEGETLNLNREYNTEKSLWEYLPKLAEQLEAPTWYRNNDRWKWNLWSPLAVVIVWTVVSVILICSR